MTAEQTLAVEPEALRASVREKYREVATNPQGAFHSRAAAALCALTLVAAVLAVVSSATPARAESKTFVVNSTGDAPDANVEDGTCETATAGECTLRAAIQEANETSDTDTIAFNIPGDGPHTIQIKGGAQLPTITEPVVIDGYTQSGASPNTNEDIADGSNAVLMIELDGTDGESKATHGLQITGGGSTVRGLVINGFFNHGIQIRSVGNVVEGNFLGTDTSGDAAIGNNMHGVGVGCGSHDTTIGGTDPGARNVISGNTQHGVEIVCFNPVPDGTIIRGNLIGTNAAGTAALGNGFAGVDVSRATSTTIMGNVISGNSGVGVDGRGLVIRGNLIGTNAAGTEALPNFEGIVASGSTIGGTTAADRNVISGNLINGLRLTTENVIQGNFIGTDGTGNAALGNGSHGVWISGGFGGAGSDNTIGGTEGGAGNVISGNGQHGVLIESRVSGGISVTILIAARNKVQGNRIGTNAAGTAALGNLMGGVVIRTDFSQFGPGEGQFQGDAAPRENTVGGDTIAHRNVISGNGSDGVWISGRENPVQGNFIGTNAAGTAALGNAGDGARIRGSQNAVGGTVPGAKNTIAFNQGNGVVVSGGTTEENNPILGNSIFDNGLLGISLQDGGNNLQSAPVLSSASAGSATIAGTLDSVASTAFRVEFFANPSCDPSGHGEGETLLGWTPVDTDGSGAGAFEDTFPDAAVSDGDVITATATRLDDGTPTDTSEFSACVTVGADPPPPPDVACDVTVVPAQSIQAAINAAEPGDTVCVEAGTYTESLTINKDLTLSGAGGGGDPGANTIIQAHAEPEMADDSVIRVEGGSVEISGVHVRHGGSTLLGGGIFNNGLLSLTDSTVTANRAVQGGGIWNNAGRTLDVTGSTIAGNTALTGDGAGGVGGGIFNRGTVNLTDSTVSANVTASGGGVYNEPGGTVNLTSSMTSDNTARFGGGVYNDNGTVRVREGSAVSGNFALADATQFNVSAAGGGIFNSHSPSGTARVWVEQGSVVSGNVATRDPAAPASTGEGGGIWNGGSGATVTLRLDATVTGNSASNDGGGIWNGFSGTVDVQAGSTISGNTASGAGGGIWNGADTPTVTVTGSSITGNTGGGIVNDSDTAANATENWWGSATGPTHASNQGGSGEIISDGVAYSPWCSDELCTGDLYGRATRLVFATQPGGAVSGEPLTPQPSVRAEDEEGHLAINFTGQVTLTSEPEADLDGTTAKNAVDGVATFTDVSIMQASTYTLVAAADALVSATSEPFTVDDPPPTSPGPTEPTAPGRVTVSTGSEATAGDPLVVKVESPLGHPAGAEVVDTESAPPSGWLFATRKALISAPQATASTPIVIEFRLHASQLGPGQAPSDLAVLRDGVFVALCTDPEAASAAPDPCVRSRTSADDEIVVVVLTSRASTWHLAVRQEEPAGLASEPVCPTESRTPPFPDVDPEGVHAEAIGCVAFYDIARGFADGTYGPELAVRRDQMAGFIARTLSAAGYALPEPGHAFTDLDGNVHADAVGRLAAAGIVHGTTTTTYGPDQPVRRDQMARFLVRALEWGRGETLTPAGGGYFADTAGNVHEDAINVAFEHGLAAGTSPGAYSPALDVRRDQMATFLVRLLGSVA